VRHVHTNYDELLALSADRLGARLEVSEQVATVLRAWEHGRS